MANDDPAELGWRIHSAIVTWTSGVDTKASFALAIESAIMVAVIGLAGQGRRLHGIVGSWENVLYYSGIGLLSLALMCVAWVVRPRLRTGATASEWRDNFIYFGHARKWHAAELADALKDQDVLPVLSQQIIEMSKVAWRKHKALQWSMNFAVIGVMFIALVAAIVGN